MMAIAELRGEDVSAREACEALGVPRANYYRWQQPARPRQPSPRPTPARALEAEERQAVLEVLHEERFADRSPAAVYATLLDEARYLCSPRTMYRILAEQGEVRDRRNQRKHPKYAKPELLATAPNQVWSWDLTKLRAEAKWTYYYLYVVLDIFSRLVVAWMLAHRESGVLARDLFARACEQQGVEPGQLVVHADRGSAPTAKTLAQLHADLGVDRSFSRPRVSNDNPFSEAQFKTLKYTPGFPDRFGSYEDARSWCQHFFPWYNQEHRHSGIAYLTPAVVHYGQAEPVLRARREVLERVYAAHPERFPNGLPQPAAIPEAVWINPPEDRTRVDLFLAAARKACLPGVEASRPECETGSRIAAGDERSELVLDAVSCSGHSIPPHWTQEDLH
jgi:transposase InsO family protein